MTDGAISKSEAATFKETVPQADDVPHEGVTFGPGRRAGSP